VTPHLFTTVVFKVPPGPDQDQRLCAIRGRAGKWPGVSVSEDQGYLTVYVELTFPSPLNISQLRLVFDEPFEYLG
jgi:hypothetical protein